MLVRTVVEPEQMSTVSRYNETIEYYKGSMGFKACGGLIRDPFFIIKNKTSMKHFNRPDDIDPVVNTGSEEVETETEETE